MLQKSVNYFSTKNNIFFESTFLRIPNSILLKNNKIFLQIL